MKIVVTLIPYQQVKPWMGRAAKDGVCLKDTAGGTTWFGALDEQGALCGVAGATLKAGKGRIRGVFVLPEHRGKKIGSTLMDSVLEWFCEQNACYIDQLSSLPGWWIKRGWKIKAPAKRGAWIYKII